METISFTLVWPKEIFTYNLMHTSVTAYYPGLLLLNNAQCASVTYLMCAAFWIEVDLLREAY